MSDHPQQIIVEANIKNRGKWTARFEAAKREFGGFKVANVEELYKIHKHRKSIYKAGPITHRFRLASGEEIICRKIDDSAVATPPPPPPGVPTGASETRGARASLFGMDGSFDSDGNIRTCPKGSIPVLVPSLQALCSRHSRFQELFAKHPTQVDLVGDGTRAYARAYSATMALTGTRGSVGVWKPDVDELSIAQTWSAGGSGDNQQTVESGWTIQPPNQPNPTLFIYFTTQNYNAAYPGGYNLIINPTTGKPYFTQTDSSVILGSAITSVSVYGNADQQYYGDFAWSNHNSQIWFGYVPPLGQAFVWVGYYPASLFATTGIQTAFARFVVGGEVLEEEFDGMGSGHFASEGETKSCKARTLQYTTASASWTNFDTTNMQTQATKPQWWTVSPALLTTPAGGNYFYFGGPGSDESEQRRAKL